MKYLLFIFALLITFSCSDSSSGSDVNLSGFTTEKISGSEAVIASKRDGAGILVEKGVLRNEIKDGIWMTYHDNGRIKTIASYVDGKLNGTYLELNNRGQIESKVEYRDEKYDGIYAKYRFGRTTSEMHYSAGVLNGPFSEYNDRGKLQRKGEFKNGKQHGKLQYFDDDENLIMEYEYDNGEKISGGIISEEEETN